MPSGGVGRALASANELSDYRTVLADSRLHARTLDFAFFALLAEAAGNLVFLLVMNSIRDVYFRHAERLSVVAGHRDLVPLYREAAAAIGRRDASAARETVSHLAARQSRRVRALG